MPSSSKSPKHVDNLTHADKRKNLPTGELKPLIDEETARPIKVEIADRDEDLDPQLVWRGKRQGPLEVKAPPLFIQEKIHPKHLIDELQRQTDDRKANDGDAEQIDLFADFNGVPEGDAKTEFYQHDAHWTNRMILGDALEVMTSLAERENLKGKVQCIYIDPPYGINFNSNFQWSTTDRGDSQNKVDKITREPEQVKAFRDTWRDGIHSYLSYLKDRLLVARELLTDSGSCFVQIGDENVHRVRVLMDEVFGEQNFVSMIQFRTTGLQHTKYLSSGVDHIVWYKNNGELKFRKLSRLKVPGEPGATGYTLVEEVDGVIRSMSKSEKANPSKIKNNLKILDGTPLTSAGASEDTSSWNCNGVNMNLKSNSHWKTNIIGRNRLDKSERIFPIGNRLEYKMYLKDYGRTAIDNSWESGGQRGFTGSKIYVVQTAPDVIEKCILMSTDPGDLVLDPTCGSGTTAYVAEKWGRRWVTIDTSRVALALARTRIIGARYPWYLLSDSKEGQMKTAEITRSVQEERITTGDIRLGFVYERVPHIMLRTISRNEEIDILYERLQPAVENALQKLNSAMQNFCSPFAVTIGGRKGQTIDFQSKGEVEMPSGELAPANGFMEWEVPREAPEAWPVLAKAELDDFWAARIKRQEEIDASIAAKAEFEYLYDQPYEDKKKVRVAGPFTVESCDPHRMLGVDEDGEAFDPMQREDPVTYGETRDFTTMILDNLSTAGVQQARKSDKIVFDSLEPYPGRYIQAEGKYEGPGGAIKRAGVHVGPEYGTVLRSDLVAAAVEARESGFDILIACGFNFGVHASDFANLAAMPVLKARMNADLHMGGELKESKTANLFVVFGEPDIELRQLEDGRYEVEVLGVDIWDPKKGEVRSSEVKDLACWFLDDAYTGEAFHVRHAYFLGANDPYGKLKKTLKAEIDREAWDSLNRAVSRPFEAPSTGRIAVKVINHLGDEVLRVLRTQIV